MSRTPCMKLTMTDYDGGFSAHPQVESKGYLVVSRNNWVLHWTANHRYKLTMKRAAIVARVHPTTTGTWDMWALTVESIGAGECRIRFVLKAASITVATVRLPRTPADRFLAAAAAHGVPVTTDAAHSDPATALGGHGVLGADPRHSANDDKPAPIQPVPLGVVTPRPSPTTPSLDGLKTLKGDKLVTLAVEDAIRAMANPKTTDSWLPLQPSEGWYLQSQGIIYLTQTTHRRRGGFIGVGSNPAGVLATAAGTHLLMSGKRTTFIRNQGTAMVTNQRFLYVSPGFRLDAPLASIKGSRNDGLTGLTLMVTGAPRSRYSFEYKNFESIDEAKSWIDVATVKARGQEKDYVRQRLYEASTAATKRPELAEYFGKTLLPQLAATYANRYGEVLGPLAKTNVTAIKSTTARRRRMWWNIVKTLPALAVAMTQIFFALAILALVIAFVVVIIVQLV